MNAATIARIAAWNVIADAELAAGSKAVSYTHLTLPTKA